MESDGIHARGVVMREGVDREDAPGAEGGWLTWLADCGVPAISGVDTRALVRHIRDKGSMRGGIFDDSTPESAGPRARRRRAADDRPRPGLRGHAGEPIILDPDRPRARASSRSTPASRGRSCATCASAACGSSCTRAARPSEDLLARDPDAIFLANGPGDPGAMDYVVDAVRGTVGKVPVFGICMGHQLLCRAIGLDTYKLPFGHRGANHPVKDLTSGQIDITSQNHGFAVQGPNGEGRMETDEPVRWDTDFGVAELRTSTCTTAPSRG